MRAIFRNDEFGRLWFTYATNIKIRFSKAKLKRNEIKEKNENEKKNEIIRINEELNNYSIG